MDSDAADFQGVQCKYPFCLRAGIDPVELSYNRNSHPHAIPNDKLLNGLIYETSTFKIKWGLYRTFVRQWMGPAFNPAWSHQRLKSVVDKLKKERASLMRKKNEANQLKLRALLEAPFSIPLHQPDRPQVVNVSQPSTSGPVIVDDGINTCRRDLKNALLREKRHKKDLMVKSDVLRANQREIRILKNRQKFLLTSKRTIQLKLRQVRARFQRKEQAASRWAPKKNSRGSQSNMPCLQCEKYEEDLDLVHSTDNPCRKISFMTNNKFTPELVACVLALLDNNVGISHVSPVISAVLKLVKIVPERLPTASGVRKMGELRRPLSHLNVAETLTEAVQTTFYSDETSKYGQQYESFLVTTKQHEAKVLGIRELADKSSETTLSTLREVIWDLDQVSEGNGTPVGKNLLVNIKNTMSDRAQTEVKFQTLLQEYRASVLPEIWPHWDQLSQSEQRRVSKMHNFFCGLHILVNMAEMSAVTCSHYEEKYSLVSTSQTEDINVETPMDVEPIPSTSCTDGTGRQSSASISCKESRTIKLVRTACKAFARGGDERNGCFGAISLFLRSRNISVMLTRFKGNRFNILFHNAGVLYYLHRHIAEFLQSWHTPSNLLLASVASDMKDELLIAGCRALGLSSKLVTGPLWRNMEKHDNILQMNTIYNNLMQAMMSCSLEDVVHGRAVLVEGHHPDESDEVWKSLIQPSDNDVLVQDILQSLLCDFVVLLRRLLQDQLPGGENWDTSDEKLQASQSSLRHNKLPETIFAHLDFLEHHKPSATALTHEATIMYRFNEVGKWLDRMTEEEFHETLRRASTLRKLTVEGFRVRHLKIKEDKFKAMLKKKEELQRKRAEALRKKTQQTSDMICHGLWQCSETVDNMLRTHYKSNKERVEAVKVQLRFRRNVLGQTSRVPGRFAFSKSGKPFSLPKLVENLKALISEAESSVPPGQKESFLVHKTILHTFTMESGEDEIFRGKVISQVPGYPKWFNVVYEKEAETVYSYDLEDDLKKGFLSIVE